MEFKLISIASIIAFYGCYFVKMFHQKKQGIQTDQIGKNKVGFVKFVEITMKIAAILVFIAGLSSIFFRSDFWSDTECCGNGYIYRCGMDDA